MEKFVENKILSQTNSLLKAHILLLAVVSLSACADCARRRRQRVRGIQRMRRSYFLTNADDRDIASRGANNICRQKYRTLAQM
jgi:hypothetical protein